MDCTWQVGRQVLLLSFLMSAQLNLNCLLVMFGEVIEVSGASKVGPFGKIGWLFCCRCYMSSA